MSREAKINIQYYTTDYGELILGGYQGQLCLCDWKYRRMRTAIDERIQKGLQAQYYQESSEIIETTKKQLEEYFDGKRKQFDLPLWLVGTDFQKTVWNQLVEIPYGMTSSYLALAERLSNKEAIRAVAAANGANAISIIVPCHRVIGSDGSLVGYAGGVDTKKRLLRLEGSISPDEVIQQKLF